MGFLSKIIADVVETAVDVAELGANVVVDAVTLPIDIGEGDEAMGRTKEKLKEMREDES